MEKDVLYLASQSISRKRLLSDAKISFKVLQHKSDECGVIFSGDYNDYVLNIAKDKMKHVDLSGIDDKNNKAIFILTADTLVFTVRDNHILGKPENLEDAKRILRIVRSDEVRVVTGCCLKKMVNNASSWQDAHEISWTTTGFVEFIVSEEELDEYFYTSPEALRSAGAAVLEGFGQRFCKNINGSYSAVLGLPIFELFKNLKKMKFIF